MSESKPANLSLLTWSAIWLLMLNTCTTGSAWWSDNLAKKCAAAAIAKTGEAK